MSWKRELVDPAVEMLACEGCGTTYVVSSDDGSTCPACGGDDPITVARNAWRPERLVSSIVRVRYRKLALSDGVGGMPVTVDLSVRVHCTTHIIGETPDGEQLLVLNDDNPLVFAVGRSAGPLGVRACGVRTELRLVEKRNSEFSRDGVAWGRDTDDDDDDDDGWMPAQLWVLGP